MLNTRETSSRVIPVFFPFAGCKTVCTYCNQGAITKTQITSEYMDSALSQIEDYLSYSHKPFDTVAFYGGSFTGISREIRLQLYELASSIDNIKHIKYSTRPDCVITEDILEMKNDIAKYNISLVELGVQSLNNRALSSNRRPYNRENVFEAINKLLPYTKVGVQLMPGFYDDNEYDFYQSVSELVKLPITTMRLYPTLVFKGTELYSKYLKGEYSPIDLETAVKLTVFGYIYSKGNDIDVIRMGLPGSISQEDYVAGCFHPSFGDIVKSRVIRMYVKAVNNRFHPKDRGVVFGFKAMNRDLDLTFCDKEERLDFSFLCKKILEKIEQKESSIEDNIRRFEGSYNSGG